MIFLISYVLTKDYYQGNTEKKHRISIVTAASVEEAEEKLATYWDDKDEEYYVTHTISVEYTEQMIQ